MIRIKPSECICGVCNTHFYGEWEYELCSVEKENGMGDENDYQLDLLEICPSCGNTIEASMEIFEYPIGTLETQNPQIAITDSANSGQSKVNLPQITFFDL